MKRLQKSRKKKAIDALYEVIERLEAVGYVVTGQSRLADGHGWRLDLDSPAVVARKEQQRKRGAEITTSRAPTTLVIETGWKTRLGPSEAASSGDRVLVRGAKKAPDSRRDGEQVAIVPITNDGEIDYVTRFAGAR